MRIVVQFAGVFLHVDAPDADTLPRAADLDLDLAVLGDGQFVLGDLVSLRQVGVEIVLAREARSRAIVQPVASAMRRA
jgi:hypothetical protein